MDVTISPLTEAEAKGFSARNQWLDHTRALRYTPVLGGGL
jgi:hypothetical protein